MSISSDQPAAGGHLTTLRSAKLRLTIHPIDGTYDLHDHRRDEAIFTGARFHIDQHSSKPWAPVPELVTCLESDHGVVVTWLPQGGYGPERRLDLRLHDDWLEIRWSVRNQRTFPLRIRQIDVLWGAAIAQGIDLATAQHLVMGAGAEPNPMVTGGAISADNGAMMTWVGARGRRCLVLGGLRYRAYARRVTVIGSASTMSLGCYDPHGVTVDPGATYTSEDTCYLAYGEDPFHELERYGEALALANNARPNLYDFPTLCGWMVSTKRYGEGISINHSAGLVEQCDVARARGMMAYTPVAFRLEPDSYCYANAGDTQQGWFDDPHWRRYGALTDPYPTMRSFCAALEERGGIPFTYVQSSLPSNDFALEHPQWMLNKDISLLHHSHQHQLPHVRYDFTCKGLQEHMRAAWRRMRDAGIKGVKFDYPETAWSRHGGFEDRHASTTEAYRNMFRLCREGLGPEAYIHERNLGGSEHEQSPRLDITAGIVDLQRVWGDASHFEPEMASRIGLRWYKSRSVFSYYPDGKSFYRDGQPLPTHERRAFLSLIAFLSGRLELGSSFGKIDDAMFRDLTRVFPMLPVRRSPRPCDMLLGKAHPEVYALHVDQDQTQVLLINNDPTGSRRIGAPISGDPCVTGSIGLDPAGRYHVHEFWSQAYLGCLSGSATVARDLCGGEAAMLVLRRTTSEPQLIATDRHLYQGWLDCHDLRWDSASRTLRGSIDLVAGDPATLTIACNGHGRPAQSHDLIGADLIRITIACEQTGRTPFAVSWPA